MARVLDVQGYRKEEITVMKDDAETVSSMLQPTEYNIVRMFSSNYCTTC